MELKVVCQCGQKYAFDVEPVGGRMPATVNCPVCNTDGTATANAQLAELSRSAPPPPRPVMSPPVAPSSSAPPSPPPPMGGLKINREAQAAPPPPPPMATAMAAAPLGAIRPLAAAKASKPKAEGEFNLVRGILGAVIGSAAGCGLLYGFWIWAGFRFPLSGVATGIAAGYAARWLARGTDSALGAIAAAIAAASVAGLFVVMYGEFPMLNIISVAVCASMAYRIAS